MKDEVQKTHYEECWRDHHDCAVLEYARSIIVRLGQAAEEDRPKIIVEAIKRMYEVHMSGKISQRLFVESVGEILDREIS